MVVYFMTYYTKLTYTCGPKPFPTGNNIGKCYDEKCDAETVTTRCDD